jgi:Holliday junction resolvase RusA-like endonuclease
MTTLRFSIPGRPRGWDRPSIYQGRPIEPKWQRVHKALIRKIFTEKYPEHEPWTGPFLMRFVAIFETPKSFSPALHQAAAEGRLHYIARPDKENIEKLILDALNGIAYVDDAQQQGGGVKRYGPGPERVDIEMTLLEGLPTPGEQRRIKAAQPQLALVQGRRK